MGVQGLWQLLQAASQPVTLESFEGQVVAVDASLWLYHFLKAMRTPDGNLIPNAHIIGFFRRISKLLYAGVLPLVVFDGSAPILKQQTVARRKNQREGASKRSEEIHSRYLDVKLKQYVLEQLKQGGSPNELNKQQMKAIEKIKLQAADDEYKLPNETPGFLANGVSDDEEYHEDPSLTDGLTDINIEDEPFKCLPIEVQKELLHELRIKSRQPSWERVQEIIRNAPTALDFSKMQVLNLVKRNNIWLKLDELIKKEAAEKYQTNGDIMTGRIESSTTKDYVLIKNVSGTAWTMQEKEEQDVRPEYTHSENNNVTKVHAKDQLSATDDDEGEVFIESKDVKVKNENLLLDAIFQQWRGIIQELDESRKLEMEIFLSLCVNNLTLNDVVEMKFKLEKRLGKKSVDGSPENLELQLQILEDVLDVLKQDPHLLKMTDGNERTKEDPECNILHEFSNISEVCDLTSEVPSYETGRPSKSSVSVEITEDKVELTRVDQNSEGDIEIMDDELREKTVSKMDLTQEKPIELIAEESVKFVYEANMAKAIDLGEDVAVQKSSPIEETMDHEQIDLLESDDLNVKEKNEIPASGDEEDLRRLNENKMFLNSLQNHGAKRVHTDLVRQVAELQEESRRERTQMSTVSSDMILDVQELLLLFGIPFMTAPQEAEAQCAELLRLKIVDAIITDDSDVFLFGGSRVLRSVFSQSRYAELYCMPEIEKKANFSRESLVQLAYLLGSDYTDGVFGVGPRLASEIINAWPSKTLEGLEAFRKSMTKKDDVEPSAPQLRLMKRLRNVILDDSFPNADVWDAYFNPEVDSPKTTVQWTIPNMEKLRDYLEIKLSWEPQQTYGYLSPIAKKLANVIAARRLAAERIDIAASNTIPKRKAHGAPAPPASSSQPKTKTARRGRAASKLTSLKDLYEKAAQRNSNTVRR